MFRSKVAITLLIVIMIPLLSDLMKLMIISDLISLRDLLMLEI